MAAKLRRDAASRRCEIAYQSGARVKQRSSNGGNEVRVIDRYRWKIARGPCAKISALVRARVDAGRRKDD